MHDLFLRLVFRFFVTQRSLDSMFGHRVERDRPLTAPAFGSWAKSCTLISTPMRLAPVGTMAEDRRIRSPRDAREEQRMAPLLDV